MLWYPIFRQTHIDFLETCVWEAQKLRAMHFDVAEQFGSFSFDGQMISFDDFPLKFQRKNHFCRDLPARPSFQKGLKPKTIWFCIPLYHVNMPMDWSPSKPIRSHENPSKITMRSLPQVMHLRKVGLQALAWSKMRIKDEKTWWLWWLLSILYNLYNSYQTIVWLWCYIWWYIAPYCSMY